MAKIDLKKEYKYLYTPSVRRVVEVDVPAFNFLMIDGMGDPNTSQAYSQAIEALFSVSYKVKFMIKKGADAIDYAVMPLEGLWWADDMSVFASNDKSNWKWTMMIMQPAFVDQNIIDEAISEVQKKKNISAISELRFEAFTEGRCAQILHIGPFSEEGPTIQRVHDFIAEHSEITGKHHEIYLSDIRRAAPEKWKTVIRQPML
jgi:hypothetical protein